MSDICKLYQSLVISRREKQVNEKNGRLSELATCYDYSGEFIRLLYSGFMYRAKIKSLISLQVTIDPPLAIGIYPPQPNRP